MDIAKKLVNGARVLFLAEEQDLAKPITGSFLPVFWSPIHFPSNQGLGLINEHNHPAISNLLIDRYSNWNWWALLRNSKGFNLAGFPKGFQPIVQAIPNFVNNGKYAYLFEAQVGKGRLMATTMNLVSSQSTHPMGASFFRSLGSYLSRPTLPEAQEVSVRHIMDLLKVEKE